MARQMSAVEEKAAYQLIYAGCELEPGRFTSNLPINAEVWLAFWRVDFAQARELLLTPHVDAGVTSLRHAVTDLLPFLASHGRKVSKAEDRSADDPFVAANESHVLVNVDFFSLLRLLPLTTWWAKQVVRPLLGNSAAVANNSETIQTALQKPHFIQWMARAILIHLKDEGSLKRFKLVGQNATEIDSFGVLSPVQSWALRRIINVAALYIALTQLGSERAQRISLEGAQADIEARCRDILAVLGDCLRFYVPKGEPRRIEALTPPMWSVAVNRLGGHAVAISRRTVKADAAARVFDTGGKGVRWAVVDSGIDARHAAFVRIPSLTGPADFRNQLITPSMSRIVKTLDFTRFAYLTSGRVSDALVTKLQGRFPRSEIIARAREIELSLERGQMLDWSRIEPLLEVPHEPENQYAKPHDTHGTHVAGILGASWEKSTYDNLPPAPDGSRQPTPIELADGDVYGVCPQVELLDLRVFDPVKEVQREGSGTDEFAILAALQYVRYLNQSRDKQYVHGVNLSLSLKHEVRSYACGSTPICVECERLVANGVVVVAAAGNFGYDDDYGASHLGGAFRGQSITDPGNAQSVITVGSTHRTDPYRYGISYFSSHGPTGDGRNKPDLVAPGEKIVSTIPDGGLGDKDGTSMAAPHVSGIAALLLSRNTELMGHPAKVKEVLCKTASDLGRDRVFQGYGLVDALRALQAV